MSGLLVALEGIDGAGTTTQVRLVGEALAARGISVHPTRQPSDGPIGRLIREILGGAHRPVDATTMGLLFAADRADHIRREVEPALGRGAIVLSDRWTHSSLAYQGTEAQRGWIAELNREARWPDLTVFLDVDPAVAAARRRAAGRPDELYDADAVQRRVAAGYREVMAERGREGERVVTLDGGRPSDELMRLIVGHVVELRDRAREASR